MNPGFGILYTIFIVLFILMVIFGFYGISKYYNVNFATRTINLYPECQPPLSQLIDASGAKVCSDGDIYIQSLGMILSSVPTPYINACSTACTVPTNFGCENPQEQLVYDRCVKLAQPEGCSSISNPVARINTNYYYVSSIGSC